MSAACHLKILNDNGSDAWVFTWLRSKGEGHLTRINDILTRLMEAEQRTR